MADEKIAYRYTGGHEPDGRPSQWYEGVPARDLTQAEFDALDAESQKNVKASAFYEKAAKADAKPA